MRRTIYYYYNRHAGLVFRYSDSNGNYATRSYCFILSAKPCGDSAKSSGWNINQSNSSTCIRNRSEAINRKNAIFGSMYEAESA